MGDVANAYGVSVDASGVVTVFGAVDGGFPTTPGAFRRTNSGRNDVFVSRLDPSKEGSAQLLYSTFLGGSHNETPNDFSVDVDGVGTVTKLEVRADETWVDVSAPGEVLETLVPKGWVAVDGASLTVAALGEDTFSVALIPTTLAITTLGTLTEGSRVNIEGDPLGKHVARWMKARD